MAEYENNNNNGTEYGNGNVSNNGSAANPASQTNQSNPVNQANAGSGNSYTDYRSGYYRNTSPHQDEPIGRTSYSGSTGNTGYNSSGYTNQTGSANGYNYANYYTNNTAQTTAKSEKKKNSRNGLKITAFVTAAVLLTCASFAGGYFISKGSDDSGNNSGIVTPADDSSKNKDNNNDNKKDDNTADSAAASINGTTPSFLELAARKDAITIPEIVAKTTPSVVGVQATFVANVQSNMPSGFNFGYFGFDNGSGSQQQKAVGTGTGVIMSEDGYIVTNAHVIYDSSSGYGVAQSVEVQMADQKTVYDANIVAYDVESDLAVLKIEQTGLTPAEFGNSDECQVGELVVAIGNPLGLELQNTVTCGIISALNRQITINDKKMRLIQTDTAINSGNSGGPLINSAGQVVGINSAKMSSNYLSDSASIEGIGFAIPITEAKEIVDDLIEYGYVTGRPQLGITCQDVSESVSEAYNIPVGAYIISVTENGAADKAGLQPQDVIIAIDGNTIKTTEELNDYKNEHDAGDQVTLTVVRQGQQFDAAVTLEEAVANAD